MLLFLSLSLFAGSTQGLNNGLVRTPPLGWMSWMYWETGATEDLVKAVADTFVSEGYAAAGYQYIALDDGWTTARDPVTNALVADPAKFPSGIAALVDYVHAKGLKFGIYADVGSATCGGYSGLDMDASLTNQQYKKDMQQFADWKVDALKVDGCNQDPSIMNITYPALSKVSELKACSVPLLRLTQPPPPLSPPLPPPPGHQCYRLAHVALLQLALLCGWV
jgi:hypothetical protein